MLKYIINQSKKILKNHYFVVILILLASIIIFFNQPILFNKTLIPLDILTEFDLMLQGDNFSSQNYLLSDIVDQFYPNYSLITESFKQGIMPFWNPHVLTGTPFFADSQSSIFELTHILSYIFQISVLNFHLFSAVLLLFVLGFGTYLYLKNLKIDNLVALFGAITIMFAGPYIVWLNYPLISAFVWLPWLLLSVDKIIKNKSRYFLIVLSLSIVFMLLAGYPPIALINLLLGLFYFAFRFFQYKEKSFKALVLVVVFVLLGIGISAFQLGPSWDFIKNSQSYATGRGYVGDHEFLAIAKQQIVNLKVSIFQLGNKIKTFGILALDPQYYGNPVDRNYRNPENNPYYNFSEVTIYGGLLTFFLAFLSLIWWKKNKAILFWLITGGLSFLLAINAPFFNLLKYLPLINKISISRFRLFFTFALIILAVYGLQKIYNSIKNKNLRLANVFILVLILISFFDLYLNFHDYNLGVNKQDILAENQAVQFLQNNTDFERFISVGILESGFRSPLIPNISTVAKLYDVRGYNPLVENHYIEFANQYLTRRGSFILADAIFDEKVLDLMSVKYIICPKENCLIYKTIESWPMVYQNNNVKIFENQKFLPRSYVAYNLFSVPENEIITRYWEVADFDAYSQVIVEKKINFETIDNQPIIETAITDFSNNQVKIQAQTSKSGILVLTDNYADGWQVFVNGEKQEILRVNGLFRGVQITAGSHEVIFRYLPPNFYPYLAVSFVSLIGLALGSILVIKYDKNDQDFDKVN